VWDWIKLFFKKKEYKKTDVTLKDIIIGLSKPPDNKIKTSLQVIMDYVNFINMLELEYFYLSNDPPILFQPNKSCFVVVRPEVIFRCNYKN
jgi:hypothetical protein